MATAAGGIPEMLPPDALVPVGNAEALARKVAQVLAQPVVIPFPERFSARAMAAGILALYRAVV